MWINEPKYLKFNGDEWVKHLLVHPRDRIYCDWEKLSRENWLFLLKKRIQFLDELPIGILFVEDWIELLNQYKERIVDRCEWNLFSIIDINSMIKHENKDIRGKAALWKLQNSNHYKNQLH